MHIIARSCTFANAVHVAFGQILHFGRDNPAIVEKLRDVFQTLEELLPTKQHEPLRELLAAMNER